MLPVAFLSIGLVHTFGFSFQRILADPAQALGRFESAFTLRNHEPSAEFAFHDGDDVSACHIHSLYRWLCRARAVAGPSCAGASHLPGTRLHTLPSYFSFQLTGDRTCPARTAPYERTLGRAVTLSASIRQRAGIWRDELAIAVSSYMLTICAWQTRLADMLSSCRAARFPTIVLAALMPALSCLRDSWFGKCSAKSGVIAG